MMVYRFPILFVLAQVLGISSLHAQKNTAVDVNASHVLWTAAKVGGSHTGEVSLSSGVLTVQNAILVAADVSMNMESITCTDLTSASSNTKLVSHLKGEDFFDVSSHPKAHFRTTSVAYQGKEESVTIVRVEGVLTIKGIAVPNAFDVRFWSEGGHHKAIGTIRFDRTAYGIRYGSGSFFDGLGDRMIKDEVELDFDLSTE